MLCMQPDMAGSGKYATNADRVKHEDEIDAVISAWTLAHSSEEVLSKLKEKEVSIPSGKQYIIVSTYVLVVLGNIAYM